MQFAVIRDDMHGNAIDIGSDIGFVGLLNVDIGQRVWREVLEVPCRCYGVLSSPNVYRSQDDEQSRHDGA